MRAGGLLLVLAGVAAAGCGSLPGPKGSLPLILSVERALPRSRVAALVPGVVHARWTPPGEAEFEVVAVDLKREDLAVRPILAHDRTSGDRNDRETLLSMAGRTRAAAAVSAGVPGWGMHVSGLTAVDGKVLLAPRRPERPSMAIDRDNRVRIGWLGPAKEDDPPYFHAVSGLALDDSPPPPGPTSWTSLCVSGDGDTMYWLFAEGTPPSGLAPVHERLGCETGLILSSGHLAGVALRGDPPRDDHSKPWTRTGIGCALAVFRTVPAE